MWLLRYSRLNNKSLSTTQRCCHLIGWNFCFWLVKWSKCLLQCLWFQTSVLTWCFCYRVNLPGDAHTEPVLVPPKARRSRAFCASADTKNCRIVQLHRTTFFFFSPKPLGHPHANHSPLPFYSSAEWRAPNHQTEITPKPEKCEKPWQRQLRQNERAFERMTHSPFQIQ